MLDARRKAYLQAMGIDLWTARYSSLEPNVESNIAVEATTSPEPIEIPPAIIEKQCAVPQVGDLTWPELMARVSSCEACSRCQSRTQSLIGVGSQQADLMIVAGSPNSEEDQNGEPFVSKSGNMLTAMLAAIGFRRDQVYLTHLVKCHAASDEPSDEGVAACRHYLDRQIALVRPKAVLVMGSGAAQKMLDKTLELDQLRESLHSYRSGNVSVLASYHPAYLMEHPEEKAKAWQDLQMIHRELHGALDS